MLFLPRSWIERIGWPPGRHAEPEWTLVPAVVVSGAVGGGRRRRRRPPSSSGAALGFDAALGDAHGGGPDVGAGVKSEKRGRRVITNIVGVKGKLPQ